MFDALGYDGVSASAATWLTNLSPIIVLMGGIALSLTFAGLGLMWFSRGSAPRESVGVGAPVNRSKSVGG